jgi:acetyl-CoA C-acetyltransferase
MATLAPSDVFVAGVGLTPVGEHWNSSLRDLALEAIQAARADAGGIRPQALYAANMLAPALSGQTHLGALLADFAGLRGIEASSFEAAGASGGVALRQAYIAVRSGLIDVALVVGVEKVTDRVGPSVDAATAMAADADHEAVQGLTPAAQAGLLMRRYRRGRRPGGCARRVQPDGTRSRGPLRARLPAQSDQPGGLPQRSAR